MDPIDDRHSDDRLHEDDRALIDKTLDEMAIEEREHRVARAEWRTIRHTLLAVGVGSLFTSGTPPWLFVWLWQTLRPWLHSLTGP